jgi:N-acetylneuraminic acid mutarotase
MYGDGAKYNPADNTWTMISAVGAPTARTAIQSVATDTHLYIWGGAINNAGTYTDQSDGAIYSLASDSWTPMSASPLAARTNAATVWTGTEMLIWGGAIRGNASASYDDGARYNPTTDTWTMMGGTFGTTGRWQANFVWTGTEFMLIGGGYGSSLAIPTGVGRRYIP